MPPPVTWVPAAAPPPTAMFHKHKPSGRGDLFGKDALDSIAELEQSTPDAIKKQRIHERITVRSRVIIRPGNMSERESQRVEGVTADISKGGCLLLFPRPMAVGDIYWIVFDRNVLDVAPQLAMCKRCRAVRDDAYESGFMFFRPVDLEGVLKS